MVLSLIEKAFFLKKTQLFHDLDLDLLLALAEKVDEVETPKGKELFSAGQNANHLYFLIKGEVELKSQEGAISLRTPATFFGDESLLNESPRGYTALCKCNSLFLVLSRAQLFLILNESPRAALNLLSLYARQTVCRNFPVKKLPS